MKIRLPWGIIICGLVLSIGLAGLGGVLGHSVIKHREYERTVVVKGLSEREFAANIIIWPIEFSVADNEIEGLYDQLEQNTDVILQFLISRGLEESSISASAPAITDAFMNTYGNNNLPEYRYIANRNVTIYSDQVDEVREIMDDISEIGREGIVLAGSHWRSQPQYLFTELNEVKPQMVEEATHNARQVAIKFAEDSASSLGRIRFARQGQFSISSRDDNNPHIKTVRVVSTVEYYLVD